MPHARLTAAVTPLREAGPHGADEVEIRLAAHPGAPALPLHKGASGGELSRVMLAIEVVFAGADPVPANTDRKSTRLNSSHTVISYAVFCLKKKKRTTFAGGFQQVRRTTPR